MAIPIGEDPNFASAHIFWSSKDDVDQAPVFFYRPRSIEDIVTKTKFSKREIQLIYRSFKQLCPSGIIHKDTFREIYSQFFPHGNCSSYSSMIFKTLDRDFNNSINFEDFIVCLSIITRGSNTEKLDWIFTLYDVRNRGFIGEAELMLITESIYSLLSRQMHGHTSIDEIKRHSQEVFKKLANNGQVAISREQFIDTCLKNPDLCSFSQFDTKL
ncbi:Kv channel-interacting protein 2-like [Aphelenchoides bicaudatus]|nr:Kv channel-interacting protein 2-like [Aphelenchoides bicaudatus]